MEEKNAFALNLTAIDNGRAALRRRFSLFDLNLRQIAKVLLGPEQVATPTGHPVRSGEPSSPNGDTDRPFVSPRKTERRYTHLSFGRRANAISEELYLPCKLPHFLGADYVSKGLDELFAPLRRSRQSKILNRLSLLSPRSPRPADAKGEVATGEMVVAALRDLLAERRALDKGWSRRSVVGREGLERQLEKLLERIEIVGSLLARCDTATPEAADLCEKILAIQAADRELYGAVLPWVDRWKPQAICLHAIDIADLLRSPLDDAAALKALHFGIDANEAVACADAQWPLAQERLPGALNDRRLVGHAERAWAAGGMVSVHKLTYQTSNGSLVKVWKPEDPSAGSVASDLIGITASNTRGGTPPHYAGRAVASYRVARLLGLNLVPETEWAVHEACLGTAMTLAVGKAPSSKGPFELCLDVETASALERLDVVLPILAKRFAFSSVQWSQEAERTLVFDRYLVEYVFDPSGEYVLDAEGNRRQVRRAEQVWVCQDFGHPALRRDLIRLQWLDHLTGQVDRNPMNYLVDSREDGRVSVSAIDNDLSFPAVPQVPEPTGYNMIWLPALPTLVDAELAKAILAVSQDNWAACLHGLLMPHEFQFAGDRLTAVKARIQQLKSAGHVVPADDGTWSSPELGDMLGLADVQQRVAAAESDAELESIWVAACQHSYLLRDATKQAMVQARRDRMCYFDPAAIRAQIRDELLKG